MTPRILLGSVMAALIVVATGCGFLTERQLVGQWKTVNTPERTLDLRSDETYTLRFTGKTLGVLSDVLGPEKGSWAVEGNALVLTYTDPDGDQQTHRWAIADLTSDGVLLGDDRWKKVP